MSTSMMNETDRLISLINLDVLDTKSESVFDGLVEVAATVCNVPISLISLIDAERQWFKANKGLDGVSETPREQAFCAHTIEQGGILEVSDATSDPRFAENPLVTENPNIRFYAGATIKLTNGAHVGTLCVIDRKPGNLTEQQRAVLRRLAEAAEQILETRRVTNALMESESRFRALTEASPLGVFGTDAAGACTYANTQWQNIFGLSQEQALGYGWSKTLHPEDRDSVFEGWNTTAAKGEDFDMEFRIQSDSKDLTYVRAVSRPIVDNEGKVTSHVGSVENITEKIAQRNALEAAHELQRVTLTSIGDAVITTDANGTVTWLNPIAEKMTGWSVNDAENKPLSHIFNIVNESTRLPSLNPVDMCLTHGQIVGLANHTVLISHDGIEYGIEDSAAPIRNEAGEVLGAVLVFHDVTEQRRLSGEMSYRASHDALTGLINRSEFELRLNEVLNNAYERNSVHALMYIDLDRFKLVNDACGHSIGDQLLQQISKIMTKCVRSNDTLARIGGDEFGAILEDCTIEQAQRVAQLICEHIDDYRFTHDEHQFRIGASIGLVPLDQRWTTTTAVLQAADRSCYAAKEAGRNRVNLWLDSDHTIRMQQKDMQWATRIQQAIDTDQFELHAQRITDIKNEETGIHAEVLIRLKDGTDLIPPNIFLPAAERFHLASLVDRWVLKHSLNYLANLPDLSIVGMLCVNLSGQSVGDKQFHKNTVELLSQAGTDICSKLCLEITETVAVTNITDAASFIDSARELGVRVALDDFGAGASSFGYLKTLNVDILKIDGQFITGMIDDRLDDSAVRCFVDVAGIMKMKTVAEFVKSPQILERVKQLGIDYAQGYLLHHPEKIQQVLV